ncbi:MAG: hypothetical protein PHT35_01210 [Bacteroidales bacterium]|nr:hypothetical protein [Bacteroidales bacterium]MDD4030031.1 hypothetical protein [Bacteroidales bacterium]
MNRLIAFFFLLWFLTGPSLNAHGQYYSTGEDPARLQWNQIRIGSFRLIYPDGIDSLAFRYAWLLEQTSPHVRLMPGTATPAIPIVIHPYNLNSNGMVVWAPKRMELITTPPSSGSTNNWEKQLILHETRHVSQMHQAGDHFFRVFSWFFGQQSEGVSVGLYFPKWMLEGDAVITETFFSGAGRGRQASFLMPYKAYFLEGKKFSYDKWRYGSYRHAIPDHYALGYMKLSVARLFSGEDALARIYSDITKYPYWPFIHGKTFRRNYGYSPVKLWEPAVEYYNNIWKDQDKRKTLVYSGQQINRPSGDYVSYRSAVMATNPDGTHLIYAIKTSLARTARLVRFPFPENDREETVCLLGNINSSLCASGPYIFWSETVSGHRWAHENFSLIISYNTVTGEKKTLLPRTRYFNPVTSNDGSVLAVVHYPAQGGSELHLLNTWTGELLERHPAPRGEQLTETAWLDNNTLFVLMTGEEGSGIYKLDREKKIWETVLKPGFHSLAGLKEAYGLLYFTSDRVDNTDNIFCLDPENGSILQYTNARFGAFDPLPPGAEEDKYLYYSNYSVCGYQLTRMQTDSLILKPADWKEQPSDPFILAPSPDFNIDNLRVPENLSYPVKKYSKILNAFRFHSWMPFYFNYNEIEQFTFQTYYNTVAAGATIMSQNTLGTLTSVLGYSYHKGFHAGHLRLDYSGLLPVFSLKLDINNRPRIHTFSVEELQHRRWVSDTLGTPSVEASLQAYIPFTFHRHGWQRGLVPSLKYTFSNDSYQIPGSATNLQNHLLQAGLQYYQMVNRAPRDIFPRLGFGVNLQTALSPGTGNLFTNILYLQAYGYLPGVMRNQALKWSVAWQQQQIKDRYFYLATFLSPPRGMKDRILSPTGFKASADYAIPIWAGDPSIPDIIYIKRFQVIPFADYMHTRQQDQTKKHYWSVGTDLLMDFHLFRIGTALTAGIRYAYTCEHKHHVEFLFSIPAFY